MHGGKKKGNGEMKSLAQSVNFREISKTLFSVFQFLCVEGRGDTWEIQKNMKKKL